MTNMITKNNDVYVVKIGLNGFWGNSKPCHLCVDWMYKAGIKRVFYSTGVEREWAVEKIKNMIREEQYETKGEIRSREFSLISR